MSLAARRDGGSRPRRWLAFVCLGAALLVAPARAAEPAFSPAEELERCRQRFLQHPEERDAAMCFYQRAQQTEGRDEVRRMLVALREEHPDQPWLMMVQGHVELLSASKEAEEPYARAMETFHRLGDAEGEVLAGINLRTVVRKQGRLEEGRALARRVGEVARRSGLPDLLARALVIEGTDLSEVGHDLGRAFRLLKRAEELAFPAGSDGLKKQCLSALAWVAFRLGRLEDATDANQRLAELARSTGDPRLGARVSFTLANLAVHRLARSPAPNGQAQVLELARRALADAERTRDQVLETQSLRLIVDLLGDTPGERVEAEGYMERCMELAESMDSAEQRIACLWTRAERRASTDAEAARRDSDAAVWLAYEHGDPLYLALALRGRGTVAYRTEPTREALHHATRALDGVEALREFQRDAATQAELFAGWASDYHRLAGWTLEASQPEGDAEPLPVREALERAFAVSERLRARTLLDALLASSAVDPAAPEAPDRRQAREALWKQLAAVQRRLMDPTLAARPREEALRELRELERGERDLRPAPSHGATAFTSLEEVERGLAEDEAMLVFLVGHDRDAFGTPSGGAWVLVVTREGSYAHRIPERSRLATAVSLFSGLVERRDGSEAGAAAALHAQLLGPALAGLPPTVRRLLLVPDGPLHDLPFAALREHPGGPPLVSRFELGLVPSASLWRHWREEPRLGPGGEAFILADPAPPEREAWAMATVRAGVFTEAARLGALPEARREGRAIARVLEDTRVAPRLFMGPQASEAALKRADLSRARVLHVAAHAVVDAEAPERSALVLTPGAEEEDGILQPREIAELRLGGALVVLSSCRSASGAVLPGEGVLSLARAFFESGSRAVVASLWPLRDDEAASLVERFYAHLARGWSASAALRAAQLEAIEDGLPAAAWAGLVVLGDAALAPIEPTSRAGTTRATHAPWLVVAATASVLVSLLALGRRRADKS
ncbi:CHAT domain-containing protein [Myxococcus stipitatus]|uniref:CHAT domain-containing protein n=1 Tax=Myxococcus stipitatus TaxID=83455 RepID=UPI001F416857|nr:CHAT domain-containing protein [Myxococcus stipitatus]MCE9669650.1 CHAT domain-containing protein [Myxococcus stipitatus]